jgi:endonuclease/exonuclease/phosphatase (EEP) superfamily protein YafD
MGTTFKLMTTNLLHEQCDVADFARVLAEADPDVVVTQELAPDPAEVIAGAYPHHQLRPAVDFTGRGIATRFDAEFGDIAMPGRVGTSAILDVEGTEVRLAGVHLLNPIRFPWWVSARDRGRQLDGLFNWIGAGDGPLVVAGDFNASPRWPAYRRTARALTDLVADHAARAGIDTEPTWAWRPGLPRVLRIDHVFGAGVRATGTSVERIVGTDHAAVIVDLEVVT